MTYDNADLESLRQQIDKLDDNIHDLLIKRAELIGSILAAKKKHGVPVVQPAREARMIRRLLDRHTGPLPREAIVRIWRELVGAISLLQTGLSVVISQTDEQAHNPSTNLWDLGRDYFGSLLSLTRVNGPQNALSQVREGKATFAVLPWPDIEDTNPWWAYLGDGSNRSMQIVQRLPFGYGEQAGSVRALVLTRAEFVASGDDFSFLLMAFDSGLSRAGIMDRLRRAGLEPVAVYGNGTANGGASRTLCLVEVSGYIGADSEALMQITDSMKDYNASVVPVGGYPTPPSYAAFRSNNTATEAVTTTAATAPRKSRTARSA